MKSSLAPVCLLVYVWCFYLVVVKGRGTSCFAPSPRLDSSRSLLREGVVREKREKVRVEREGRGNRPSHTLSVCSFHRRAAHRCGVSRPEVRHAQRADLRRCVPRWHWRGAHAWNVRSGDRRLRHTLPRQLRGVHRKATCPMLSRQRESTCMLMGGVGVRNGG